MRKLLEELKIADPDCYEEIWAWVLWLADPEYGDYDENDSGYQKHRDDVIVGCVGRAIAARGWHLLQSQDADTGEFYAEISKICPGYDGDHFNERHLSLIMYREADSPAKAILTCYLAAIGSQP